MLSISSNDEVNTRAEYIEYSALAEKSQVDAAQTNALDAAYEKELAVFLEMKEEQTEILENALENLIAKQNQNLQKVQASKPGFLSTNGSKTQWSVELRSTQNSLSILQTRLDRIRAIKEGVNFLGESKMQELAENKLRYEKPELAMSWSEAQELKREQLLDAQLKFQNQQDFKKSNNFGRTLQHSQE